MSWRYASMPLVTLGVILAVCVWHCVALPSSICPDAIDSFNKLRAQHGLKPLAYSDNLAKLAGMNSATGVNSDATQCRSSIEAVAKLSPGGIVWRCEGEECKQYGGTDRCVAAADQWTSYKWVDSDTPLDDNPQGLDYAQILWPRATKAGCAVNPSLGNQPDALCTCVVCRFDAIVVRTNAALKENIVVPKKQDPQPEPKPEPKPDKYSWCSSCIVSNQKLCNDEQLQCNGGPIADCCPTSCASTTQ